eukprot:CAMPEP_0172546984 /NCGR_PEP_ID=MMETSP1067-20121228/16641_1 /TAXON_ID=265564 ORGANISM="Thalassiosira punctigera, Strain Tpunct2005C2" /NCGR_SAMPLE_ID=MMETSP1067 /ASSEMBLY_ACC=CAM_ASM_000444 /LENGTH=342 /DNA_ID=CAMNT_0013333999 /DNA_START=158 /DNA_END=1183 /DNA_ORIENTATION=+
MASFCYHAFAVAAVCVLLSVFQRQTATAFAPSNGNINHASIIARLPASIYYPEDDGGYTEDASSLTSTTTEDIFGSMSGGGVYGMSLFGQLASQLSSDPSVTSTLAKLASAFSPPGFAIDLENVNDVRCHALDGRHMEIEAVVCDDLECSSLLVPVDFPEECRADDADALADCILRNVGELDAKGEHLLREREHVFAQEGEAQRALEALQSLDSEYFRSTSDSLPEWWIPPSTSDDVSECDLLQDLLNGEDMHEELRVLATHVLLRAGEIGEGGFVRTVRVKAIGPLGVVFKIQFSVGGKTWNDDGGMNNEAVMDVPIMYEEMTPPGYGSYGQRSIREEVLM